MVSGSKMVSHNLIFLLITNFSWLCNANNFNGKSDARFATAMNFEWTALMTCFRNWFKQTGVCAYSQNVYGDKKKKEITTLPHF
jgi:hypothetical protein